MPASILCITTCHRTLLGSLGRHDRVMSVKTHDSYAFSLSSPHMRQPDVGNTLHLSVSLWCMKAPELTVVYNNELDCPLVIQPLVPSKYYMPLPLKKRGQPWLWSLLRCPFPPPFLTLACGQRTCRPLWVYSINLHCVYGRGLVLCRGLCWM